MATGRDEPGYQNLHAEYTTYKADGADIVYSETAANGSLVVGRAVMISTHRTVRLAGDGDRVRGKLVKVESDGMVSVQDDGFADLPAGDGAAVTPGRKIVGALGPAGARGYIREVAASGAAYAEAAADDNNNGRGEIIDSADTTKVIVDL
jgi:hypothetical protein